MLISVYRDGGVYEEHVQVSCREFCAQGGDLGTANWGCQAGPCASLCLQAAHVGCAAGGSG